MKICNMYSVFSLFCFFTKHLKDRIRDEESQGGTGSRRERLISFSEPIDFSMSFFFKGRHKKSKELC